MRSARPLTAVRVQAIWPACVSATVWSARCAPYGYRRLWDARPVEVHDRPRWSDRDLGRPPEKQIPRLPGGWEIRPWLNQPFAETTWVLRSAELG